MKRLYFGGSEKKRTYILVIYDISNDRRRNKIAKLLEGFGKRVQYSAFECWLSGPKFHELRDRINSAIAEDDNVRIYNLVSDRVEQFGLALKENLSPKCDLYIC